MLLSFVLRVSPEALAGGRVTGQVEDVGTGATAVFRDLEELTRFLVAAGSPLGVPSSPLAVPAPGPPG